MRRRRPIRAVTARSPSARSRRPRSLAVPAAGGLTRSRCRPPGCARRPGHALTVHQRSASCTASPRTPGSSIASDVDPTHPPAAGQPRSRHDPRARTPRPPTSASTCGRSSSAGDLQPDQSPDRGRRWSARRCARSATLKRDLRVPLPVVRHDNGHVIRNPGDIDCSTETTPAQDNCYFLSAVDNGWYASGLVVVRQALPELRALADALLAADGLLDLLRRPAADAAATPTPTSPGNQPTGQMYGGYYVDQGPAGLPQRRPLQRPAHRHVHRHGPAPDAGRRVVADLAGAPAASSAPPTRTSPGRASGRRRVTGRPITTRSPARSSTSGRATTPTRARTSEVHPDLRRRHVRGADGQ